MRDGYSANGFIQREMCYPTRHIGPSLDSRVDHHMPIVYGLPSGFIYGAHERECLQKHLTWAYLSCLLIAKEPFQNPPPFKDGYLSAAAKSFAHLCDVRTDTIAEAFVPIPNDFGLDPVRHSTISTGKVIPQQRLANIFIRGCRISPPMKRRISLGLIQGRKSTLAVYQKMRLLDTIYENFNRFADLVRADDFSSICREFGQQAADLLSRRHYMSYVNPEFDTTNE